MFEVRGGEQLADIVSGLDKWGNPRQVRRVMLSELRAAGKPFVPKVRAAIAAIPTKGTGHTGLRQRLAAATRVKVSLSGADPSVSIRVDRAKMPAGQKNLPGYMEGTKQWRHPLYGNRNVWVTQQPHPYFYRTVVPEGKAAGSDAMKRLIKKLTDDIT